MMRKPRSDHTPGPYPFSFGECPKGSDDLNDEDVSFLHSIHPLSCMASVLELGCMYRASAHACTCWRNRTYSLPRTTPVGSALGIETNASVLSSNESGSPKILNLKALAHMRFCPIFFLLTLCQRIVGHQKENVPAVRPGGFIP